MRSFLGWAMTINIPEITNPALKRLISKPSATHTGIISNQFPIIYPSIPSKKFANHTSPNQNPLIHPLSFPFLSLPQNFKKTTIKDQSSIKETATSATSPLRPSLNPLSRTTGTFFPLSHLSHLHTLNPPPSSLGLIFFLFSFFSSL